MQARADQGNEAESSLYSGVAMKLPRFNLATLYGQIKESSKKQKELRRLQMLAVAMRSAYRTPAEPLNPTSLTLIFRLIFQDDALLVTAPGATARRSAYPSEAELNFFESSAALSMDNLEEAVEHQYLAFPDELLENLRLLDWSQLRSNGIEIRSLDGLIYDISWTLPITEKPLEATLNGMVEWLMTETYHTMRRREETAPRDDTISDYLMHLMMDGSLLYGWHWGLK